MSFINLFESFLFFNLLFLTHLASFISLLWHIIKVNIITKVNIILLVNASSNYISYLDDYLFKAIKRCLYMYIFDNWIKKIRIII